jgi:uncharacterized protein (DUF1810 family)
MTMSGDPFELQRFVDAQAPVYSYVLEELRAGLKQRHWIWFIFPQMRGLGSSSMAHAYGIGSRMEAEAYLAHPIMGSRLMECTRLVNGVEGRTAEQIFGAVDAMKFRSSMTLFSQVAGEDSVFAEALRKYFSGKADPLTLAKL